MLAILKYTKLVSLLHLPDLQSVESSKIRKKYLIGCNIRTVHTEISTFNIMDWRIAHLTTDINDF